MSPFINPLFLFFLLLLIFHNVSWTLARKYRQRFHQLSLSLPPIQPYLLSQPPSSSSLPTHSSPHVALDPDGVEATTEPPERLLLPPPAQRPPDPSRMPPHSGAPTPFLLLLHVSSSVLTCILAFSLSLGHAGSTQGASPLLPPPPRLSSRHRRLRVRQRLLRSAGSMSPSRRSPSSVPDLACPRPSASLATSAGTLPTASSTCVRTTMTAPPSTVWAVPWPCSRGPPRGQASRRRRERQ